MACPRESHVPREVAFRYCTEAMMRKVSVDHSRLSEILAEHGDSVVVAGAAKASRLHLHTSHPDRLFETLQQYGDHHLSKSRRHAQAKPGHL
jgi:dihydroxyacetone kinase-like predicted kinase